MLRWLVIFASIVGLFFHLACYASRSLLFYLHLVMPPAPAFALLVIRQLIVVYTASAHAFIVSDSIAGLVACGGD